MDAHNDSCPVEWLDACERADKADKAEYDKALEDATDAERDDTTKGRR